MRTYISLIAVVATILVGQASADDELPGIKFVSHNYEPVPSDEVLRSLGEAELTLFQIKNHLNSAADKTVKVCNDVTIADILALRKVSRDDCSHVAYRKRGRFCSSLEDGDNQACYNVQSFCVYIKHRVGQWCDDNHIEFIESNEATPEEVELIKSELSTGMVRFGEVNMIMSDDLNKNVVLCDHTVHEIANDIGFIQLNECTQAGFARRAKFCDSLNKEGDNICLNMRHYCRYSIEWNANECIRYKDLVYKDKFNTEMFIDALEKAYKETKVKHDEGLHMDGHYLDKETPLEVFASGN